MDIFDAFWFLYEHPRGSFIGALNIAVTRVNPETHKIDDDTVLNTEILVMLESGVDKWLHDPDLDCSAPTFEEALIKMAEAVKAKYDEPKNNPEPVSKTE